MQSKDEVVLTPHAKEFASLLKVLGIASIDANDVQEQRFRWAREFGEAYPKVVLVFKRC